MNQQKNMRNKLKSITDEITNKISKEKKMNNE